MKTIKTLAILLALSGCGKPANTVIPTSTPPVPTTSPVVTTTPSTPKPGSKEDLELGYKEVIDRLKKEGYVRGAMTRDLRGTEIEHWEKREEIVKDKYIHSNFTIISRNAQLLDATCTVTSD